MTATIADAPRSAFSLEGAAFGRRSLTTSVGLATALGNRLTLSGEYNALFEAGERAHAISVGLGF